MTLEATQLPIPCLRDSDIAFGAPEPAPAPGVIPQHPAGVRPDTAEPSREPEERRRWWWWQGWSQAAPQSAAARDQIPIFLPQKLLLG